MNSLDRISDLINKVEQKDFTITEQSIVGDLWDLGAGAIGGLYDSIKSGISDGVPYLVDKVKGHKILKPTPFSGKIDDVCSSAAKLFKSTLSSNVESKTDVFNSLMILKNIVDGAEKSTITDADGQDFATWEVLETFTGALYYEFKGKQFSYLKLWEEFIEEDDIDEVTEFVSSYIEDNISYNATIGGDAERIKTFMVDFFESGKSFTAIWNTDRLDGDWDTAGVLALIDNIDMSEYEEDGRVMSEFETKLSGDLPCYESAKFTFVKVGNSEKINAAVKVEGKWTTILYYKVGKLVANVYHDGTNKPPVAMTVDIDCGNSVSSGQNMNAVGINESFKLISEQSQGSKYVSYGSVRLGFDSETFEMLRVLHTGKPSQTTNTTNTTTQSPTQNTNQNDSGEDNQETTTTTTVTPESSKTNTQKLIELLLSKGVDPLFANDQKRRANMGSVSVGALLGKTITVDEYIKSEEDVYAEKFIESIGKGITSFSKNETNHEKEEKQEERVIDTTAKISNPTPLELSKIEELGDDAVSKTNNELSFDKNRIKTVRITSNESKVVYVAKDDITDLVSDIESQLERIFGGDWKLDKAKNKFMSSNKLFIFIKKEQ